MKNKPDKEFKETIICIQEPETGTWSGYFLNMPKVISQGDTKEELKEKLQECLRMWLEFWKELSEKDAFEFKEVSFEEFLKS